MMSHLISRPYAFFGLLAGMMILHGCTTGTSTPTTVTEVATISISPVMIAESVEGQTSTATLRPTLPPTATSLPTRIPALTAMPNPTPTVTSSPIPSPTVTIIACVDDAPRLEKRFPDSTDLQMQNGRTFFDGDFVYLATQNYIGLVDATVPAQPRFYGFWQLPQPEQATDVLAHDGMLYVSSGSTIQVLNLNSECRLSLITQLELPFKVTRMEVEDDRLYVGGINDQLNTEQLAIFAIQSPVQLEQLGLLDFGEEPVRWSVEQNDVFLLSGGELSTIDVSDPATPVYRPIDVTLDAELIVRQPREMVDNAFYYFSSREGMNVVRQLDQIPPRVQTTPREYALDSVTRAIIDFMQIDRDYIFLGSNWCDVDCASIVDIISRENLEPLTGMGLQPHYPVHSYVEITKELVYAFSDGSVLVIDISDLKHPQIIWEVPLDI